MLETDIKESKEISETASGLIMQRTTIKLRLGGFQVQKLTRICSYLASA